MRSSAADPHLIRARGYRVNSKKAPMKTHLVVTQPFADYAKGEHITDPEKMAHALEHHHAHVVRVASEDAKAVKPPKAAQ